MILFSLFWSSTFTFSVALMFLPYSCSFMCFLSCSARFNVPWRQRQLCFGLSLCHQNKCVESRVMEQRKKDWVKKEQPFISFLLLLSEITTNVMVKNLINLLSYSSECQKCEMGPTGLPSWGQQGFIPFWEPYGEIKLIACSASRSFPHSWSWPPSISKASNYIILTSISVIVFPSLTVPLPSLSL